MGDDTSKSPATKSNPGSFDLNALASQLVPLLISQLQSQGLTAPNPPPTVAPTPISQLSFNMPAMQQPQAAPTVFVGPLSSNPVAGTSSSLLSQFPEVEAATIAAIIQHEFKGSDLYKLDSRYRDKAERGVLELENGSLQFKTEPTVKDYPNVNSVLQPLTVYFSILIAHSVATGKTADLAVAVLAYVSSLTKLATEFEWHAVLAYHMAFFARRRRDMLQGVYGGWALVDHALHGEYLLSYRKQKVSSVPAKKLDHVKEVCNLFNKGTCTTTPCRNGRVHKCAQCGRGDHGANSCSSSRS